MEKAYLILEDGHVFDGVSVGARGEAVGEVVFTTAMVGYTETLTDPSYCGQLVTQTFPLIGNYGACAADAESDRPYLSGYIVRELCDKGSNFRMDGELNDYLIRNGIVGIAGIDTRSLTRILREAGVMNGVITPYRVDIKKKLARAAAFRIEDAVGKTSSKQRRVVNKGGKYRVVLWDLGAKANIARELVSRGCEVIITPHSATAEQILAEKPDGLMLSNGGGDPADNVQIIAGLKKLLDSKLPTFGICLGHQLMALAMGAKTVKLKYGHRGANQPVRDAVTGRIYITSQNHGYAVAGGSLGSAVALMRFTNANDGTNEGIDYKNIPAFSVQFHPEACGGPLDTEFMFDRFIALMRGENNA
ncbi:MAG: carbamoyl phosphate synthase small subunit [Clostridiales bacterium]|jgi:carbamoyl-phosphate synthase small subunit|nr:carbamoyl phosphate synthase small subunit [Clostridiales bacterium]